MAAFGPAMAPYPTPPPPGAVAPVGEGKWMTPDEFSTLAPWYIEPLRWAIPMVASLAAALLLTMMFVRSSRKSEATELNQSAFGLSVVSVVFTSIVLALAALYLFAGVDLDLEPYMYPVAVATAAVALLAPVFALLDDQRKSKLAIIYVIVAGVIALIPLGLGLTGESLSMAYFGVSIVSGVLLIVAAGNIRAATKKRAQKLAARKDLAKDVDSERMALAGAVLGVCIATALIFAGLLGYLQDRWTTHWMGTDSFGWDIYSELFYGAQTSVIVGIFSAIIASVLGALVGLYSGYVGGWPDEIIMRINDVILSIPWLVLMIVIAGAISASTGGQGINLTTIILIIGITGWSATARMVRAQVLSIRERQYIERAKAIGSGDLAIIRRHVLPNAFPLVFANTILTVAVSILSEATLSFLGLRPVGVVTWGTMLSYAQADNAFAIGLQAWEIVPGLCIVIIVLGFTLLGYALDDILNPKLRKR
jgi:peptide/nickel transport system permease protein